MNLILLFSQELADLEELLRMSGRRQDRVKVFNWCPPKHQLVWRESSRVAHTGAKSVQDAWNMSSPFVWSLLRKGHQGHFYIPMSSLHGITLGVVGRSGGPFDLEELRHCLDEISRKLSTPITLDGLTLPIATEDLLMGKDILLVETGECVSDRVTGWFWSGKAHKCSDRA